MSLVGKHKLTRIRNQENVLFTTVRKFKGLEATVIIFIDIDADTFSSPEARSLFYVGTSRAKHFLDIVSVADEDDFNEMAEAITGR